MFFIVIGVDVEGACVNVKACLMLQELFSWCLKHATLSLSLPLGVGSGYQAHSEAN